MKTFKKILTAVALAAFLTAGAAPASACCGDGKIAAAGATEAGAKIITAITESTVLITGWLERMTITIGSGFGKVIAEIMKQTAAMRVIEEGKIAVQTTLYMQKVSADARYKYELSPRICFESAGGSAAAVAAGEARQTTNDLNHMFTNRTLGTPNTMASIRKLYLDHVSKYCSQADAALGRCAQPAPPGLQNADISADALLNVSSYSPQQVEAAQAFVNNAINPIPTQNIPKDWEKTPQGQAFVAQQQIEQARLSVAANSFNAAIAARVPVQGAGSAALLNKADVSELELLESQIRGRFESLNWYQMIAGFSLENLLRELDKQEAVSLYMQMKDLQRWERLETIFATQLALDVKKDAADRVASLKAVK